MDHPAEEGSGVSFLGEHHPGHAGRAVHGGRGDLRGRGVHPLPGADSRSEIIVLSRFTVRVSLTPVCVCVCVCVSAGGHSVHLE